MNNPIAGQTYTIAFVSPEDLTGATVTIEYKNDNGVCVTGVTPSGVNTTTNIITWVMTPELTQMGGKWDIVIKIVTSGGYTYYNTNEITLTFDPKFT